MKSRKINKSRLALAITAGTLGALAQQAVAAGFIEDSKASLTLRNFYINTDNRNGTASPSKQEEWGQGFILNYQSGFTQGTVGFGVDALGLLGVRLDGGGRAGKSGLDRQPGTVFPLESNGEPVHDFASLGLTAKAKVSNTEFRYGTLQPKLPVVTYNDGRLLPVTFEGGQVTSTDLKDFTLVAGQLEHSKGRNSTDNRSLSIAGANGSSASSRDSNKFYYAGGDYKVNKDLTLQYYYGNLDDFYKQHFLGLIHNWQIGPGVLKTDLRAFDSSSDGKNGSRSGRADGYVSSGYYGSGVTKGEVDNRAFSGLFTYTVSGHSIGAGYQILNGDSDFPFLNRGDGEGSTAYLITDVQIGKFQRAGERTWQVRYGYDFATVGVPGLTFNTIYLSGDKIKTARGDQSEWERDISLAYVIPDGTFKGLGFTWKNASFRKSPRPPGGRGLFSFMAPLGVPGRPGRTAPRLAIRPAGCPSGLARRRLLLGDAMDVAAAEEDLAPRDHHHLVLGEHALEDRPGLGVLGIVEARRDDAAVDDQEVHVGAGQANGGIARLAALDDIHAVALFLGRVQRAGDRHLVYHQLASLGVAAFFQHAEGGLAAQVVRVVLVVGPGQQHLAGTHVAAEVVDVAVGLVVVEAVRQPDDALHRKVVAQGPLDLRLAQVRVAVVVEQAFLGGDQRAFAVDVDRAALEDEVVGAVAGAPFDLEDLACHLVVALPGEVQAAFEAAPGVEAPVDAAYIALVVDDEGRAGVADPGIVAADFHDADVAVVEACARVLVLPGAGADGDRLEARDGLGHRGEGRLGRLAAVAPVVRTFRPDHPGLLVGFPFGGHAEAVGAWGAGRVAHRCS